MLIYEQVKSINEIEYNKNKAINCLNEVSKCFSDTKNNLKNIQESLKNFSLENNDISVENIENRLECKYTALEIAKYVINKCIDWNKPISNLQLQKLLYYIQGEYINKTNGKFLFNDKIIAWAYGPSIPDVYYKYNNYASSDINMYQEPIYLSKDICDIIDHVIKEKSRLSAWSLVESTHLENPWINTYEKNEDCVISNIELKNWFMKK